MTRYSRNRFAMALVAGTCFAGLASTAGAQGTLAVQGLGYPVGQLSTRSAGTGGAIADFDPRSPVNPAALAVGVLRGQVFGQYDPELRSVTGPGGNDRTVTARFPNIGILMPIGGGLVLGASASTWLDRTWATQAERTQIVGDDTVTLNETLSSDGGVSDLRVALAYAFPKYLRIGAATHYFSGSNETELRQAFPDSLGFFDPSQTNKVSYSGTAFSAGAVLELPYGVDLAASGRWGQGARLLAADTVLSRAEIPNRYSAAVGYSGIPGTTIAVRYGKEQWSSMTPLSTSGAQARDVTEWNAGVESSAPSATREIIVLRLGARWRELPFLVGGSTVKESSYGGGFGIPFSSERAMIDVAILRTSRTGVANVQERAWNLSFGLRVRP